MMGPEPPPTHDGEDEAELRLTTFQRLELACAVCGRGTPVEDVWRRYRACCGRRTCAACEIKLTGSDGEPKESHRQGVFATVGKRQDEPPKKKAGPCQMCGETVADEVSRLRQRAEAGDADARHVLGTSLVHALRGCGRQPIVGCKWLTLSAKAGRYDALFELALCWREGLTGHVAKPAKAARLLRRAAARGGHVGALHELALAYRKGEGIDRDVREGTRLLTMAADADYEPSRQLLARLCIDGEDVDEDRARAARLLGLERTAEMLAKGVQLPSFLVDSSPDNDTGRAFANNEYTDAEIDAFFDGAEDDYEPIRRGAQ